MQTLQEIQKMFVQVVELVGHILKSGLTDLCMECIQMRTVENQTYLL